MFGSASQLKLAPLRNQSTESTDFQTIQAPTEKVFRKDLNNRVEIPSP